MSKRLGSSGRDALCGIKNPKLAKKVAAGSQPYCRRKVSFAGVNKPWANRQTDKPWDNKTLAPQPFHPVSRTRKIVRPKTQIAKQDRRTLANIKIFSDYTRDNSSNVCDPIFYSRILTPRSTPVG